MALELASIPSALHSLRPLAEKFGEADDSKREKLIRESSVAELRELKAAVLAHDDALDSWLAGPESRGPEFSDEYIAFSAMRMAADFVALPTK